MRYLGTAVGKAVLIELGPVLTALVVAGRVGASIAAEIGTMRVTEQIDALETLALDPIRFPGRPRVLAGLLMLPVLVIFADIVGVAGVGSSRRSSWVSIPNFSWPDSSSLPRPRPFGRDCQGRGLRGILLLSAATMASSPRGARKAWGLSTTRGGSPSMVLILVADYVIASLLF